MSEENLTNKEAYDLKKEAEAGKYNNLRRSAYFKRGLLWVGVAALIGGSVWGLTKIDFPAPQSRGTATLLDAISPGDWTNGNPESKTVLVEYSDFQCPACGAYYPLVEKLLKEKGNDFKFVYRHFPLPQHIHAKNAAYAAEAAGKQGKFWEMHNLIFEHQREWSNLSVISAGKTFLNYATSLNMNIEQFEKDRKSAEIKDKVEADYQSGNRAEVNATPTFFLNGEKIQLKNYEDFISLISSS